MYEVQCINLLTPFLSDDTQRYPSGPITGKENLGVRYFFLDIILSKRPCNYFL